MNYNILFKLINNLISENLLTKKYNIKYKLNQRILNIKEIELKTKKTDYFLIPATLSSNEILLILDEPLNFILSHTIIVGKDSQLFTFKIENKKYIATNKIIEMLKNNFIVTENVEEYPLKYLKGKTFKYIFEEAEIMIHYREYIKKKLNLQLNIIHIIDDNIDPTNFIPNFSKKHFSIAQKLKIPPLSLIENNYIKDTHINIYDKNTIETLLNPILKIRQDKTIAIDENFKRIYNDIDYDIYLEINKEKIIEKLCECKKFVNTSFERLKNILEKESNIIKLSDNNSNIIMPLWEYNGSFYSFESSYDFLQTSGLEYKNNMQYLSNIFLEHSSAQKIEFSQKYFSKKIINIINNLEEKNENNLLKFESTNELIIKSLLLNQIDSIEMYEPDNKTKISQIDRQINKILSFLIKQSIERNKQIKEQDPKTDLNYYFYYYNTLFYNIYEEFNKSYNIKKLTKELNKHISNLIISIRQQQKDDCDLYLISTNFMHILRCFKFLDKNKSNSYITLFYEYFNEYKEPNIKYENKLSINIMTKIFQINKYRNKSRFCIFLKNEKFKHLISTKIQTIEELNDYKIIISANKHMIKSTFKYNYNNIIESINKSKSKTITLQDKEITLSNEYIKEYKKFNTLKNIEENEHFILFKKQQQI